jgi:ABC-2 type transport system ATP-binding protein
LCERIAIINHGGIVANDTTQNLLRRIDNKRITITIDRDLTEVPASLRTQGWEFMPPRQLMLAYKPSKSAIGAALAAVQANGLAIADLSTEETDLEDIFLQLTHQATNA